MLYNYVQTPRKLLQILRKGLILEAKKVDGVWLDYFGLQVNSFLFSKVNDAWQDDDYASLYSPRFGFDWEIRTTKPKYPDIKFIVCERAALEKCSSTKSYEALAEAINKRIDTIVRLDISDTKKANRSARWLKRIVSSTTRCLFQLLTQTLLME